MTAKARRICKGHGLIIRMVIIVLLALVPLAAGQAETVESGSCGTNVSWVLDDQGVLTISGTGPMTSIPWSNNTTFKARVTEVIVEDGVTSLYYGNTFDGFANLTKVTLADSVTDVRTYTFRNCTSLTEVRMPAGLTQIGDSLFYGCAALESITIPVGVTQIGNCAFTGCSSLTEMTLPPNLETIGSQAFEDCSGLTEIALPDALTQIGSNAFGRCRNLLRITLPDSTVTIGRDAFYGIGSGYAMYAPVGSAGAISFSRAGYTFKPDNTAKYSLKYLFTDGTETPTGLEISDVDKSVESFVFPEGITSIGDSAFSGCESLASLEIPDSVTRIGTFAFSECKMLDELWIPDGLTEIGMRPFDYLYTTICAHIGSDGAKTLGKSNWTFKTDKNNKYSLKYVYVTSTATEPSYLAITLVDSDVISLEIPDGVTSIHDSAFSGCSSLSSVTIPSSVTRIGNEAFSQCRALGAISIPESVTTIGNKAFRYCTALTELDLPSRITTISEATFEHCEKLERISIPSGVRSIGANAFSNCYALKNITLPAGITTIGNYTFTYCKALKSLTIPEGVTSIGQFAANNCDQLESISLPETLTSIGYAAFCWNGSLTAIELPDSVTTIGNEAFLHCGKLEQVTLPAQLTTIPEKMFYQCGSLAEITIPAAVETIGAKAFGQCARNFTLRIESRNDVAESRALFEGAMTITVYCYADTPAEWWARDKGYTVNLIPEDGPEDPEETMTWSDIQAQITDGASPVTVTLESNVTAGEEVTQPIIIPSGKTVILDLNGYTLNRNCLRKDAAPDNYGILVETGATLTIRDSSAGQTGCMTGEKTTASTHHGFIVNNGTLTLQSGTLSGNHMGAIENNGTFTMTGGTITGNGHTRPDSGTSNVEIAIHNQAGAEMIMSGGSITGNTAAGIWNSGSLTFSGGDISENPFGGITLFTGGSLEMSGGTIQGNGYSNRDGTAIQIHDGDVTITGGVIQDNRGYSAVTKNRSGSLTITGGSIIHNDGRGIWAEIGSSVTLAGNVDISGNAPESSQWDDSDIYLGSGSRIHLTAPLTPANPIVVTTADSPASGKPVIITEGYLDSNRNPRVSMDDIIDKQSNGQTRYKLVVKGELAFSTEAVMTGEWEEATVILPADLTEIGAEAFANVMAESIECPEGLQTIGSRAFAGNTDLERILIPESVTSIAADAFDSQTDFLLYGQQGSYAETYANTYDNITFVICREQ